MSEERTMDQRGTPDRPGTGEPNGGDHGKAAQGTTNLPEEAPFEHSGTPPTLVEAAATIERLRHELAQDEARSKQNEDHLLRVRAELENFKRRMQREKA